MNYGGKGIKQKKRLLNSATTKLGTKLGIFFIKLALVAAIAVVVSGSCLVLGSFQGIIENAPDIASVNVSPEGFATKIYDSDENEIQTLSSAGANRTYVTIDQIPKDLQHAFIAIEDERFYEHNGIDMRGILRAASITLSSGEMSQGASTITQQLLKNNVFNAFNESTIEKIKRKVQEQYLAIKLETVMSKDAILENYLNTINLGNGYYGVQAAAREYFNKDVSELSISECAVIASITKSPTGLNPIRHADRNKDRQSQVLLNMKEQGYIPRKNMMKRFPMMSMQDLKGLNLPEHQLQLIHILLMNLSISLLLTLCHRRDIQKHRLQALYIVADFRFIQLRTQ